MSLLFPRDGVATRSNPQGSGKNLDQPCARVPEADEPEVPIVSGITDRQAPDRESGRFRDAPVGQQG